MYLQTYCNSFNLSKELLSSIHITLSSNISVNSNLDTNFKLSKIDAIKFERDEMWYLDKSYLLSYQQSKDHNIFPSILLMSIFVECASELGLWCH